MEPRSSTSTNTPVTPAQSPSEQNNNSHNEAQEGTAGGRKVKKRIQYFQKLIDKQKTNASPQNRTSHVPGTTKNYSASVPDKDIKQRAVKQANHSAEKRIKPTLPSRNSSISISQAQPSSAGATQWQPIEASYQTVSWQQAEKLQSHDETSPTLANNTTDEELYNYNYVLPNHPNQNAKSTNSAEYSKPVHHKNEVVQPPNLTGYSILAQYKNENTQNVGSSEYSKFVHYPAEDKQSSAYNKVKHNKHEDSSSPYSKLSYHWPNYTSLNSSKQSDITGEQQLSISSTFESPRPVKQHSKSYNSSSATPYAVSPVSGYQTTVPEASSPDADEEHIYDVPEGEKNETEPANTYTASQPSANQQSPESYADVVNGYTAEHNKFTQITLNFLSGYFHQLSNTRNKKLKTRAKKQLKALTTIQNHKKSHQLNALLVQHQTSALNAAEYQQLRALTQWLNKTITPLVDYYHQDPNNTVLLEKPPELPALDEVSAPEAQRAAAEQTLSTLKIFAEERLPGYINSLSTLQGSRTHRSKSIQTALDKLKAIQNAKQFVSLTSSLDDIANNKGSISAQKIEEAQKNIAWINQQLEPALKKVHGNKASVVASAQLRLPDSLKVN